MEKSKKWTLNKNDLKNQLKSALIWLTPMALVYLGQLLTTIAEKKVLGIADLNPDLLTIGAIQLYLINQFYGLFNKLKAEK